MNNLDPQYIKLLEDILDNGVKKQDRTGTGTLSVFGRQIRHKMSEGFPLLTTKKMPFRLIATELIWFLRGDTNIKFLVDNNCHIWDGDAYKGYEKECVAHGVDPMSMEQFIQGIKNYKDDRDWIEKIKSPATHFIPDLTGYQLGDLGPVYGKQWRKWQGWMHYKNDDGSTGHGSLWYDQILRLIADLERNPDSRRLMVNAWNVGEIDQMVLPPCHYGFQVYTRELSLSERTEYKKKRDGIARTFAPYTHQMLDGSNIPTRAISLMWNQRSCDTFLGLPFNIASYGLLLEIIAKEVNMVPEELIGNLGDTHLYLNHIEQSKEQIGRELSLEERKQIFEDSGYVCDVWPFNGDWSGEYDGFGIPKRTREPYPLPKLFFKYEKETYIDNYELDGFILKDYQAHPHIKAPLSN